MITQLAFKRNTTRVGLLSFSLDQEKPIVVLKLLDGNNFDRVKESLQSMQGTDNSVVDSKSSVDTRPLNLKALGETVGDIFNEEGIETNGRFLVLITQTSLKKGSFERLKSDLNAEDEDEKVSTLLVDIGQNNVGENTGTEDSEDIFQELVSVRPDDLNSVFPNIMDGIVKAKKNKSKLLLSIFFSNYLPFSYHGEKYDNTCYLSICYQSVIMLSAIIPPSM